MFIMWSSSQDQNGRHLRFFLIGLSHDNLVNHYQSNFRLMQNHQYSLHELENMIPWERELYVTMLIEYIKEQEERQKLKG